MNYHEAITEVVKRYMKRIYSVHTKLENKLIGIYSIDDSTNDKIIFENEQTNYICAHTDNIVKVCFNSNIRVPESIEELIIEIDNELERGTKNLLVNFINEDNSTEIILTFS